MQSSPKEGHSPKKGSKNSLGTSETESPCEARLSFPFGLPSGEETGPCTANCHSKFEFFRRVQMNHQKFSTAKQATPIPFLCCYAIGDEAWHGLVMQDVAP